MAVLTSQGHVVFDDQTPEEFRDLVSDTLETSEYIETETITHPAGDLLVIKEVK